MSDENIIWESEPSYFIEVLREQHKCAGGIESVWETHTYCTSEHEAIEAAKGLASMYPKVRVRKA